MTTRLLPGQRVWEGSRDGEGFRTWKVTLRTASDTSLDGPATHLLTPGLPKYGDVWQVDNDQDLFAWCRWDWSGKPVVSDEPNLFFDHEFTFSTKPPEKAACHKAQPGDPLLEPQKVSGDCVNYQEEATHDRFGFLIVNSAHEQIRGPQVEFDKNRAQIIIEQNVAALQLAQVTAMVDTLNKFPLWGLPPRRIKLSKFKWSREFYGTCFVYYKRAFTFDIRNGTLPDGSPDSFDKVLMDEGTKVLSGHWDTTNAVLPNGDTANATWILDPIPGYTPSGNGPNPDPSVPSHFVRAKDRNGENMRLPLDGGGRPADISINTSGPYYISLTNNTVGNPLTNTGLWALVVGSIIPPMFDTNSKYKKGNLVVQSVIGHQNPNDQVYIATVDVPTGNDPNFTPGFWIKVTQANIAAGISGMKDAGIWDINTNYSQGDYVRRQLHTGVGKVRVIKYDESDFTFLQIPLVF